MAQTIQIVPKYSFPYVETVINDYTQVSNSNGDERTTPTVTYVFPFTSSKGKDNVFIRKASRESFVSTFGESNYKKYSQPLMMPLNVLSQSNTVVWAMRVMPENATYSNKAVSLYYKADSAEDTDASKRKFRIKFTQKVVENATTEKEFSEKAFTLDGETVSGVYTDSEGYTQAPFIALHSEGRGTYGDSYCMRITPNTNYEKEYGIKMYNFNVLTVEGGLQKVANYVGSLSSSIKYDTSTFINDILENTEAGVAPVYVEVNEDSLETVYDAYIAFCKEQHEALLSEYDTKYATYKEAAGEDVDFDGIINGTVDTSSVDETVLNNVAELKSIKTLIEESETENLPDLDQFDPIFGTIVASTDTLPFICFVQTSVDDTTASNPDYTATTDLVEFSSTKGVVLSGGSNGYFDNPRTVTDPDTMVETQWTYEQEVENCLIKAFDGTYDRRILASRRIPVSAFWDANYPFAVKTTMANLALVRNDCVCYLDAGIEESSYSDSSIKALISDFSIFDNALISKNLQHYKVVESSTQKKVTVTITYFLAARYAFHCAEFGSHIPFVKSRAQLSGHVRDSLEPTIEDYEVDLKEKLYNNRFNYFETLGDNIFQRSTQNTSQIKDTDLIEESNVTTLYAMKRIIEADIHAELYDFADSDIRSSFATYEKAKFSSWIGTKIESFDIEFSANEWESAHSILHAYLAVTFRGLQKRSILEIDINKRSYTVAETAQE